MLKGLPTEAQYARELVQGSLTPAALNPRNSGEALALEASAGWGQERRWHR